MMLTMAQLAEELHVDRRQVYSWYARRARNGFPEAVNVRPIGIGGRTRKLWHLHEVKQWHRAYTPSKGGRPKSIAKDLEETC